MTVAVRTPVVSTPGLQLGNRIWRKQLMKKGKLHYQGQDLDITDDYLRALVEDFRSGSSMDTVPFFYANERNEHNENPELRRGNLMDLELAEDGLYGVFRLTDPADELVTDDDKFGVSVHIRHNHTDGNGVQHPAQLTHVLGTYDPVWTSLRPWQQVDEVAASNTGDTVIDFTALTLASEGETPEEDTKGDAAMPKLQDQFTDEEITRLRALLDSADAQEDENGGGQPDDGESAESGDEELSADELADIEAIAATLLDDSGGDEFPDVDEPDRQVEGYDGSGADVDEPELVAASNPDGDALRLANEQNVARIEQLELANQRLQATNDARAFEQERDQLARDYGIPPKVTNRLRPLLEGSGRTVQLTNSTKSEDAGKVVREALKELAQVGFVDLSNPAATGHDADAVQAAEEQTRKDRDDFLSRVESEYRG